jgi:hypothetical protein
LHFDYPSLNNVWEKSCMESLQFGKVIFCAHTVLLVRWVFTMTFNQHLSMHGLNIDMIFQCLWHTLGSNQVLFCFQQYIAHFVTKSFVWFQKVTRCSLILFVGPSCTEIKSSKDKAFCLASFAGFLVIVFCKECLILVSPFDLC